MRVHRLARQGPPPRLWHHCSECMLAQRDNRSKTNQPTFANIEMRFTRENNHWSQFISAISKHTHSVDLRSQLISTIHKHSIHLDTLQMQMTSLTSLPCLPRLASLPCSPRLTSLVPLPCKAVLYLALPCRACLAFLHNQIHVDTTRQQIKN